MNVSHEEAMHRNIEIDMLRGIGIVSVLLIHSTVQYLSNPFAYFLWDYSQFSVQLLVFCSSYIYFIKEKAESSSSLIPYLKKRVIRLLKPYYIFLLFFLCVLFLFSSKTLSPSYILQSLTITGGVDINWLVLLFLQFTILFPILSFLKRKSSAIFTTLGILSLVSAILLVFIKFPWSYYKLVMWLPWLVVGYYSIIFIKYQRSMKFLSNSFFLFLAGTVLLHIGQQHLGHSVKLYDNKYPPNLYYLLYGLTFIPFFVFISRWSIFNILKIESFLEFLSKNSFSLFFIHYVVIYFLLKLPYSHLPWYVFFLIVLTSSLLIQNTLNRFSERFNR